MTEWRSRSILVRYSWTWGAVPADRAIVVPPRASLAVEDHADKPAAPTATDDLSETTRRKTTFTPHPSFWVYECRAAHTVGVRSGRHRIGRSPNPAKTSAKLSSIAARLGTVYR